MWLCASGAFSTTPDVPTPLIEHLLELYTKDPRILSAVLPCLLCSKSFLRLRKCKSACPRTAQSYRTRLVTELNRS